MLGIAVPNFINMLEIEISLSGGNNGKADDISLWNGQYFVRRLPYLSFCVILSNFIGFSRQFLQQQFFFDQKIQLSSLI